MRSFGSYLDRSRHLLRYEVHARFHHADHASDILWLRSIRNRKFRPFDQKSIQGNQLVVTLRGTKVTEYRDNDGDKKTRSDEIYRDQVVLEAAREYPAGYSAKYDFQIATPNVQSPEFMNSGIGQTLVSAFRLLSDRRTRIKWKIEARLDAKGIDLAASKSLQLNLGQFF